MNECPPKCPYLICLLPVLILLTGPVQAGTVVVAQSGDPAPVNSGEIFGFEDPVFQRGGAVATTSVINAGFSQDPQLLRFAASGGTPEVVVVRGKPSPDGDGNFAYAGDLDPFVNDAGVVAFQDGLDNTLDGATSGIFVGRGNGQPLSVVIRNNGQNIPELGDSVVGSAGFDVVGLTTSGDVAFTTTMANAGLGIWRGNGTPGSLKRIVAAGDPNPTGDGTFSVLLDWHNPVMNDSGQVAFKIYNQNPLVWGIYRGSRVADVVKIARVGDAVPSGNGTYSFFHYSGGQLSINDSGEVAFSSELAGTSGGNTNNSALFRGNGTTTVELVRKGDPMPDGNGSFLAVNGSQYDLNNRGDVLFAATASGAAGGATSGIFLATDNGVEQVARLASPAPGGGTFVGFSAVMALNNVGQVALIAEVDAGGFSSEWNLFFYKNGKLRAIASEGDTLPGGAVILRLSISGGASSEGRSERSLLNDYGQVAYTFYFPTGDEGLAVWSPGAFTFADGFESGNTSVWSSVVP